MPMDEIIEGAAARAERNRSGDRRADGRLERIGGGAGGSQRSSLRLPLPSLRIRALTGGWPRLAWTTVVGRRESVTVV